ncbi:hypothetical protein KM043_006509 [Ampulex compressa]|nr:hypothetical protein KM043_006509 [Ampulex compressa]
METVGGRYRRILTERRKARSGGRHFDDGGGALVSLFALGNGEALDIVIRRDTSRPWDRPDNLLRATLSPSNPQRPPKHPTLSLPLRDAVTLEKIAGYSEEKEKNRMDEGKSR